MLPENCKIKSCHRPAYTEVNGLFYCNAHALQNNILPANNLQSNHGHKKVPRKKKTFVLKVKKV